nr:reverse transcriptase domain-containing protein [Tanacetum cinerariifolium]
MFGSPKPRHSHSESPRKRDMERKTVFKRLETGLFHRLGDKGKSMSAYSNDSSRGSNHNSRRDTESCHRSSRLREIEFASEKRHNKRASSRRTEAFSKSEGSAGEHWKSKPKRQKSSVEDDLSQPWCHMFNSTLTRNTRVWFDDLPKESIADDLKEAFLENYLQQKKCIKDPVKIHNIKQRDGESMEEFVGRYKLECRDVKGAPKCMKISEFMHGITNPELIKRLHDKIPKSVDEMMGRQIEEILKAEKLSHLIKELKQSSGKDQAKAVKREETSGKKKPPAILMVQSWQRVAKQKITQNFSSESVISFPPLGEEDGTEGPIIIEAKMGGHFVHHMYVDGGSSSEIMYEHCFNRFLPESKSSDSRNHAAVDCESENGVQANEKIDCGIAYVNHTKRERRTDYLPRAAKEAISAVLMTERGGKQMPIYFISRALQGPEINYTPMEKLIVALVSASKRLKRLLKWSFELEEHDIHYRPITSVKGQILADFIMERLKDNPQDTAMGDEETLQDPWILFTGRSSYIDCSGACLILTNPEGMEFRYAPRFRFDATNNEAEYEALIAGLRIVEQMGIKNLQANIDLRLVANQEVLTVVKEEGRTWMTPIHEYLVEEILPEEKKKQGLYAARKREVQGQSFKDWCEKLCMRQCFAFVKHPQANGLVERANRSLGKGIKARLDERSKHWLEEILHVLWAHRTMIKSINRETPFSLTYGTEAVILVEISMPTLRTAGVNLIKNDEAL